MSCSPPANHENIWQTARSRHSPPQIFQSSPTHILGPRSSGHVKHEIKFNEECLARRARQVETVRDRSDRPRNLTQVDAGAKQKKAELFGCADAEARPTGGMPLFRVSCSSRLFALLLSSFFSFSFCRWSSLARLFFSSLSTLSFFLSVAL